MGIQKSKESKESGELKNPENLGIWEFGKPIWGNQEPGNSESHEIPGSGNSEICGISGNWKFGNFNEFRDLRKPGIQKNS